MAADANHHPLVLAIDDEPEILDILRMALEGEGFRVHTANDPNEGVAYFEKHATEVRLVLLDFLMPAMTGDLVFECLQRTDPEVRVLVLTGCDDHVTKGMFEQGLRGCIQKPFYLDDLIARVREEIEALD
jgi:DNA-binding response OmpR family regulator